MIYKVKQAARMCGLFFILPEYIIKNGKSMTRIILYETKAVYVDGYKSILRFDEHSILLQCHNKLLEVTGEQLTISCYTSIEMKITGIISEVRWVME